MTIKNIKELLRSKDIETVKLGANLLLVLLEKTNNVFLNELKYYLNKLISSKDFNWFDLLDLLYKIQILEKYNIINESDEI